MSLGAAWPWLTLAGLGVDFLRRDWINFDLLWIGALVATGFVLIAMGAVG